MQQLFDRLRASATDFIMYSYTLYASSLHCGSVLDWSQLASAVCCQRKESAAHSDSSGVHDLAIVLHIATAEHDRVPQ